MIISKEMVDEGANNIKRKIQSLINRSKHIKTGNLIRSVALEPAIEVENGTSEEVHYNVNFRNYIVYLEDGDFVEKVRTVIQYETAKLIGDVIKQSILQEMTAELDYNRELEG